MYHEGSFVQPFSFHFIHDSHFVAFEMIDSVRFAQRSERRRHEERKSLWLVATAETTFLI